MQKKLHYFGGVLPLWERWLNRMCSRGYRLSWPGKLSSEFVACAPNSHEISVKFLVEMSQEHRDDHRRAWEEMGYQVWFLRVLHPIAVLRGLRFRFNGNIVFWRDDTLPEWPEMHREIVILQKRNDGAPFQYRGAIEDTACFLHRYGSVWYWTFGFVGLLAVFGGSPWLWPSVAVAGGNCLRYLLGNHLNNRRKP